MKVIYSLQKHFIISLFITTLFWTNNQSIHANKLPSYSKKPLVVYIVNVGQGDAIYIDLFGKKNVMIDAGPFVKYSSYNNSQKKGIYPFLKSSKIKKIDLFVISHPHLDHIGGLKKIILKIPVRKIFDPGYAFASKIYENILILVDKKNIPYQIVRNGLKWNMENVSFEVISPKRIMKHTRSDANSNSIVIRMVYKNISFLFPGDIEKETEYEILGHNNNLRSTFLKSPHHGSDTSNTLEFIHAVQPRAVFISCGKKNIFNHPSPDTLKRYKKLGIPIYRTDIHGTIKVSTDGYTYNINTTLKNN